MGQRELDRIFDELLNSLTYKEVAEEERNDYYGEYVSSRNIGRWMIADEDDITDDDVHYQFANGSYRRPRKRRRSRYPKYEYPTKDIGYSDLFDKPTEPPDLEAGDTAQLDSFLGSFTTR